MKISHKFLAVVLSTVLAVISFSASAADDVEKMARKEFLFIQNADSATIETGKKPNEYLLVLHEVQPYTTYFSGRPSRLTGVVSTEEFINNWQKKDSSFNQDPPNAGFNGVNLSGIYGDKKQNQTVALILSNPQYDSDKNTLTYVMQPLNTLNINLSKPDKFKNVVLFIDDTFLNGDFNSYCPSCDP